MRIHADPDPQPCLRPDNNNVFCRARGKGTRSWWPRSREDDSWKRRRKPARARWCWPATMRQWRQNRNSSNSSRYFVATTHVVKTNNKTTAANLVKKPVKRGLLNNSLATVAPLQLQRRKQKLCQNN